MTIGSDVKSIGNYAFANCANLKIVTCIAENIPTTKSDPFKDSYVENSTLRVPAKSVSAYSNTAFWNTFGTIEGITDPTSITTTENTDCWNEVEYFTLDGKKVYRPSGTGIYIVKKDGTTKKFILKK